MSGRRRSLLTKPEARARALRCLAELVENNPPPDYLDVGLDGDASALALVDEAWEHLREELRLRAERAEARADLVAGDCENPPRRKDPPAP